MVCAGTLLSLVLIPLAPLYEVPFEGEVVSVFVGKHLDYICIAMTLLYLPYSE